MQVLLELYKTTAQHEARRKRELIASECVRLGRINIIRSHNSKWGEQQLIDVWEEGYAAKDLRVKESLLFKKKSELENRRKTLANLQRANTRSSNKLKNSVKDDPSISAMDEAAMNNISILEMDITTEYETLKYHGEQIRM